jgi:hypothetical protein
MGTIIKVCAANFSLPEAKARDLAKTLTTAYKADRWNRLLGEVLEQIEQKPDESKPQEQAIVKQTPKQDYLILLGMARRDTFDGVGRLIHKEIEFELGKLTSEEVVQIWEAYNRKDTITAEGSIYLIYWGGKDTVDDERGNKAPIIPPAKPELFRRLEIPKEETYEKGDYTADKETDGLGEVSEEEDADCTEAE